MSALNLDQPFSLEVTLSLSKRGRHGVTLYNSLFIYGSLVQARAGEIEAALAASEEELDRQEAASQAAAQVRSDARSKQASPASRLRKLQLKHGSFLEITHCNKPYLTRISHIGTETTLEPRKTACQLMCCLLTHLWPSVQAVEERHAASVLPQRKMVMSRASSLSRAGSAAVQEQQAWPDTATLAEAALAEAGPAADVASPAELTSTSSSDGSSAMSQEVPSEPLEGAVGGIEVERQHSAAADDVASVSAPAAEVRSAG